MDPQELLTAVEGALAKRKTTKVKIETRRELVFRAITIANEAGEVGLTATELKEITGYSGWVIKMRLRELIDEGRVITIRKGLLVTSINGSQYWAPVYNLSLDKKDDFVVK